MNKNIIFLSVKEGVPPRFYWDQYLLEEFFAGNVIYEGSSVPKNIKEAIVIIPGAYQSGAFEEINLQLAKLDRCFVIITSDEENKFDLTKIKHPNMKLFSTYPHKTKASVTWLPIGYPPHISKLKKISDKSINVFFSGQVNNKSREDVENFFVNNYGYDIIERCQFYQSNGFSQGMERQYYMDMMSDARVVPAPRGNISPDSFRLYEALESGAIPIAEDVNFWSMLFPDAPFPIVENSDQWRGYIQDALNTYPVGNNKCQSWWIREKYKIKNDLLSLYPKVINPVTIVMPISPIPSHPDTKIFEETYKSIRYHHPIAPLIITFDGVRTEQEKDRNNYNEHIRRVLWLIREDRNVIPYIFDTHIHQVGMMKAIIDSIESPTILYMEHDCPLVTDYSIDWDYLYNCISFGKSNLIRFHFEAFVPEVHEALMLEHDNDLLETAQWSQRPHIASTAFYKRIIRDCFSSDANCFIEDVMHGKVHNDYIQSGRDGWLQWRLHIYHPNGVIKRSYTLDGREGGNKFDNTQIW